MLISNYCGQKLEVKDNCDLRVRVKDKDTSINFVIVKTLDKSPPILGISSLQDLGLVKRNNINEIKTVESLIEKEKDLFEGTGKIKIKPCELKLKENYDAKVIFCRRVPFQLIKKLENELKRMV